MTCPCGMPPRRTSWSKPWMCVFTRASAMPTSRAHRARDPEASVVEDHRQVAGLVLRPAHLHDPKAALRLQGGDHVDPELDHSVREEVLVPPALEHMPGDQPVRSLRDDEARDREIAEPLEEAVHLPPPIFELREDLESLEGIDHDQVEAPLLLDRLDAGLEGVDPILLLAEDVGRGPRVEDDEGVLRPVEL